jgi:hypothetical protein
MFDGLMQQAPRMPIGERQDVVQQEQVPYYHSIEGQELGKLMLDSSPQIKRVILRLMGLVEKEPNVFEDTGEKLMNSKGAARIAMLLDSHVGKDVFLSKISEEDVVRIIRDIWIIIIREFIKNIQEWDMLTWKEAKGCYVIDTGGLSLARSVIINPIYLALKRAQDATEKGFFADTHQSKTISSGQTSQQYKKGFFN